jgi:hypothetical protein
MPPYAWVPCTNGASNCQEFATGWAPAPAAFFGRATASRDAVGNPRWLMLARDVGAYESAPVEYDLYDTSSGTPLGAWRNNDDPQHEHCFVEPLLGQTTVTINALLFSQGFYVANGDPPSMMEDPLLHPYSSPLTGFQDRLASDRVFAFDLEPQGIIARTDFGSGTLQQAKGNVGLLLSMVEGDDVFAYSEEGSAGWGQLYVVDATGTLTLLRSNPSAHVATPASDGTRIYWTETYGSSDVTQPQTSTEFWSAPYTADPVALAATASKFATIQNPQLPITSIAFGGLMAMSNRNNTVFIARVGDGKVIQPSPGPSRYFSGLVAVTPSELWAIESIPQGSPNSSLSRIGLGTW